MEKFKKYKKYFINIILVLIIISTSLYLSKVFPFGDKDFAFSDGAYQFKPFLYDFIIKLRKGMLTNYSFNNGLGNPFIFNFLYYLSGPINIIAIFFKNPSWMYLSVVLTKIIIATITMTKYASSKTDNKYYITVATISYVFCSWLITYSFYLSWLDAFMIFPLLIYGLDKMFKKNKAKMYIFSLSYLIISNFYLAFSVCIFVLIYTIYYLLISKTYTKKEKKTILKKFILSNMFVLGICFFWLYACLDSYFRMNMSSEKMDYNYIVNFKLFLAGIIYGNITLINEHFGETMPTMACNILITFNFFYFFLMNNKIKDKFKVLFITILVIFIIFSPTANFMLNMFHNIRGLTYRYSFIILFLEVDLYLKNADKISFVKWKDKLKALIPFSIIIGIAIYEYKINYILLETCYVTIVMVICYLIYIFLYSKNKYYNLILIFIISLEAILAISHYYRLYPENYIIEDKYKVNEKYRTRNSDLKGYWFYLKIRNAYNLNANLYNNDKSLNLHTSMTYNKVIDLLNNIGEYTNNNSVVISIGNNSFVNMLFNVKDSFYLEKIYSVNEKVKDLELEKGKYRKNIQNLANSMAGEKVEIFNDEVLEGEETKKSYNYNLYHPFSIVEYHGKNGIKIEGIIDYMELDLKKYPHNDKIKVYYYDATKLCDFYEKINKNQIKYTKYDDNHIKGTIKVNRNQLIFTSIPYDTNWKIYLDGKKVKPIKLLDSLIGIEAKEGKHTLELKYSNNYLIIPALISIISIIIVIRRKI